MKFLKSLILSGILWGCSVIMFKIDPNIIAKVLLFITSIPLGCLLLTSLFFGVVMLAEESDEEKKK